MKRVLIVSPHFPPVNAADMHRVRMVLPFLRENGWEAEVLAVRSEAVAAPKDEWLEAGLPEDVPIHRVKALGLGWSRVPGLGTLGWRALPATQRAGDALLREKKFDLVYFSSTQWPVHLAGPHWKRRSGVPFAMDYQDPWVNDYYRRHPEVTPPGGRLRYAAADALSRWTEPRVLRECSGYTSVSEAYPADLTRRYPWSATIPHVVMPFPGSERDFERVRSEDVRQTQFDPQDGKRHWVYVGRGGKDMETAAHALFRAVAEHARTSSGFRGQVVMHFIGTSYAPAGTGRATISPIAAEYGISEMVREHPDRIPYSETLRCLLDATSIIALGSNDASYTASKIYPCLLAGKPLLVVCHEQSGVVRLMEEVGGGVCVTFGGERSGDAAENIRSRWLECGAYKTTTSLNRARFERYMERASAAALARFWEKL
ncbi:MAG: glycosyltransferase [Chthoniobacterales bacterium]